MTGALEVGGGSGGGFGGRAWAAASAAAAAASAGAPTAIRVSNTQHSHCFFLFVPKLTERRTKDDLASVDFILDRTI